MSRTPQLPPDLLAKIVAMSDGSRKRQIDLLTRLTKDPETLQYMVGFLNEQREAKRERLQKGSPVRGKKTVESGSGAGPSQSRTSPRSQSPRSSPASGSPLRSPSGSPSGRRPRSPSPLPKRRSPVASGLPRSPSSYLSYEKALSEISKREGPINEWYKRRETSKPILEFIDQHGLNPNDIYFRPFYGARQKEGYPLLLLAIDKMDRDLIDGLLERGASREMTIPKRYLGDFGVHELIGFGLRVLPFGGRDIDYLKYLLSRGFVPTMGETIRVFLDDEEEPIEEDDVMKQDDILKLLFKKGQFARSEFKGLLNKYLSITDKKPHKPSAEIVQLFLEKGAGANERDEEGYTPLINYVIGVYRADPEIVDVLLRNGADIDADDGKGSTPLTISIERESLPNVKTLLSRGANPNRRDRNGLTPTIIAHHLRLKKILKELIRAGGILTPQDKSYEIEQLVFSNAHFFNEDEEDYDSDYDPY